MTATQTGISWTDTSWNPIRGCSRVSTGCEHCYAETLAGRFSGPGQPYEGLVRKTRQGVKWTGEVRFIEKDLGAPLRWRKPKRIFVNSMSDLFHESVPDEWIDSIVGIMWNAQWHTFQILTKRPERMHTYFTSPGRALRIARAIYALFQQLEPRKAEVVSLQDFLADIHLPLQNIWLGVSCENQVTADERIPWLLKTPAAVRFVSAEPLLGPVNLTSVKWHGPGRIDSLTGQFQDDEGYPDDSAIEGLRWVICGGESGPKARPHDTRWLSDIVQACRASDVACWVKQDSGSRPGKQGRLSDNIWNTKEFPVVPA